jgi:hypothetical protein
MSDPSQSQKQHQMELEKTHPSGADEWYCPTCGRRFLMQYSPNYKKIVMEVGDESAAHSGGKGGLQMGPLQMSQDEDYNLSDELRDALDEALNDIDLDDWALPPA